MDAKDVWQVPKFIIAATGLKTKDARALLDEIPKDRYARLFLMARKWDSEQKHSASQQLEQLLGDETMSVLEKATELARKPSTALGEDDDEDKPLRNKRKK
jgi:hypothetical protein